MMMRKRVAMMKMTKKSKLVDMIETMELRHLSRAFLFDLAGALLPHTTESVRTARSCDGLPYLDACITYNDNVVKSVLC